MLCSYQYIHIAHLFGYIPMYFIFSVGNIFTSVSECSLLADRNTGFFWILILYPAALFNSIILVDFCSFCLILYVGNYIISKKKTVYFFLFFFATLQDLWALSFPTRD